MQRIEALPEALPVRTNRIRRSSYLQHSATSTPPLFVSYQTSAAPLPRPLSLHSMHLPCRKQHGCRNVAGHLQWKVMAPSVTWSRLSSAPGGQSKIVVQADFGDILPQMHPRSHWFNCKHCAHARFVESSHVGTICTDKLKFSFNSN